jgi:hypothetical protein
MWTRHADGTVINGTGKIINFGEERFLNDICLGDCCFICGAKPAEKPFNNEHVFPEWLLRRLDLFDKSITLPNGASLRYDRYTVPCCAECNSRMGDKVETPVSEAVGAGYDALVEFIEKGNPLAMAIWLRLIFVKTHLKDRGMRGRANKRLVTFIRGSNFTTPTPSRGASTLVVGSRQRRSAGCWCFL